MDGIGKETLRSVPSQIELTRRNHEYFEDIRTRPSGGRTPWTSESWDRRRSTKAVAAVAAVIATTTLSFAFRDPFKDKSRTVASRSPAVQPVAADSSPQSAP
jgi:hypothetical protein